MAGQRCPATTAKGKPCTRFVTPGMAGCCWHGGAPRVLRGGQKAHRPSKPASERLRKAALAPAVPARTARPEAERRAIVEELRGQPLELIGKWCSQRLAEYAGATSSRW